MATGKKGKKTKGKTFALTTFLQETSGPLPTVPIRPWADEVEDSYESGHEPRSKSLNVILPTAPKASRDYEDFSEKVPKDPPYMAYLSNLPYDLDEDEISLFFKDLKISKMNIPKDERPGEMSKLKGFGYVEFDDRDSLINALRLSDTTIKNRRIRIEVAANSENDKRRGRMDMGRDRENRSESVGDWRAAPRENTGGDDRRGGYNRDNRDGGFTRDRDNRDKDRDDDKPGGWRESRPDAEPSTFSRNRDDRGGYYDSDRGGRYGDRDGGDRRGGFDRDGSDRDRRGGFNRGGFDRDRRGGGYGSRRYDDDGGSGGFSRSRGGDRDDDSNRSSEPRQRQKLMLAPRTKPLDQPAAPAKGNGAPAASTVPSSASIFGNAKPVDTAVREREIEERLAKEQEKPRDGSRDRRHPDDSYDKRPIERSRRDVDSHNNERPNSLNRDEDRDRVRPPSRGVESSKSADEKRNDKPKREERRERVDKEMPKLKEVETPNFAQNNKFAFLQDEDNSD